jgi:hypothetical protein
MWLLRLLLITAHISGQFLIHPSLMTERPEKWILSCTDRGRVVGVQIDDPSTVYSYNTSANKGGKHASCQLCHFLFLLRALPSLLHARHPMQNLAQSLATAKLPGCHRLQTACSQARACLAISTQRSRAAHHVYAPEPSVHCVPEARAAPTLQANTLPRCASFAAIWAPGGPSSDGTSVFVGTGNTAGALNSEPSSTLPPSVMVLSHSACGGTQSGGAGSRLTEMATGKWPPAGVLHRSASGCALLRGAVRGWKTLEYRQRFQHLDNMPRRRHQVLGGQHGAGAAKEPDVQRQRRRILCAIRLAAPGRSGESPSQLSSQILSSIADFCTPSGLAAPGRRGERQSYELWLVWWAETLQTDLKMAGRAWVAQEFDSLRRIEQIHITDGTRLRCKGRRSGDRGPHGAGPAGVYTLRAGLHRREAGYCVPARQVNTA